MRQDDHGIPPVTASNQGATAAAMGAPASRYGATRPILGVSLAVLSVTVLSGMDASAKWMIGVGVPVLLLVWMRYVVHLALVLMLVLPTRGRRILRSGCVSGQIMRGATMLGGTLAFFTVLRYLPQAEATAINFLAPLLVLVIAPWALRERPRLSRWIAAGTGFAGVLIIVRPNTDLDPIGVVYGLIGASCFALQYIATRRVAVDDSFTTMIWSGAMGAIGLTFVLPFVLPSALPTLAALSPGQWALMFSLGFWGAIGHLLQITAFQKAPASLLAPFGYMQIVSAAGLGWLVWGHFPDALTWLGIGIICASGIVIGIIEWRRR